MYKNIHTHVYVYTSIARRLTGPIGSRLKLESRLTIIVNLPASMSQFGNRRRSTLFTDDEDNPSVGRFVIPPVRCITNGHNRTAIIPSAKRPPGDRAFPLNLRSPSHASLDGENGCSTY